MNIPYNLLRTRFLFESSHKIIIKLYTTCMSSIRHRICIHINAVCSDNPVLCETSLTYIEVRNIDPQRNAAAHSRSLW